MVVYKSFPLEWFDDPAIFEKIHDAESEAIQHSRHRHRMIEELKP